MNPKGPPKLGETSNKVLRYVAKAGHASEAELDLLFGKDILYAAHLVLHGLFGTYYTVEGKNNMCMHYFIPGNVTVEK